MQALPVVYQGKGIAADAVAAGFNDRQGDGRGERGINCIAAAAQRLDTGFDGQWL